MHTIHDLYVGLARTIYLRCIYGIFWQGNHEIYSHIRCIYTILANPIYMHKCTVLANPIYMHKCMVLANPIYMHRCTVLVNPIYMHKCVVLANPIYMHRCMVLANPIYMHRCMVLANPICMHRCMVLADPVHIESLCPTLSFLLLNPPTTDYPFDCVPSSHISAVGACPLQPPDPAPPAA